MILLVSGATQTIEQFPVGHLIVPAAQNRPETLHLLPQNWAMDNGAFKNFHPRLYVQMLRDFTGQQGCLFVTVPDIVGNANATLRLFPMWARCVRAFGFPPALVAQDGLTVPTTPWEDVDALFIGGTTEFKESRTAQTLVAYAKARGLWVHMGRVNSRRRIRMAREWGVDSIDGTGCSRWPKVRIPMTLRWMGEPL